MFLWALTFYSSVVWSNCNDRISSPPEVLEARQNANDFEHQRSFTHYENMLTSRFSPGYLELLRSLKDGEIYLDSGTGSAVALRGIARTRKEKGIADIRLVGVGYKKPADPALEKDLAQFADRLQYIDGGPIERLIGRPKLARFKGQVSVLTEILGPLAYSKNLAQIFSVYADLLRVGGQALIFFDESSNRFQVGGLRLTLNELSHLIPQMTGARLRVRSSGMRLEGVWPQFSETVLWLEKVQDKSVGAEDPFRLISIVDNTPPLRSYEVELREDPYELRAASLEREKTELQYASTPSSFAWPRRRFLPP